jgi:hypothetical protein
MVPDAEPDDAGDRERDEEGTGHVPGTSALKANARNALRVGSALALELLLVAHPRLASELRLALAADLLG